MPKKASVKLTITSSTSVEVLDPKGIPLFQIQVEEGGDLYIRGGRSDWSACDDSVATSGLIILPIASNAFKVMRETTKYR